MKEHIRDRNRLEHIVEAIDCILDFADGKTKEELESDKLKFYGIVKNIEIIGEAVNNLTRTFCRQHSETPWTVVSKMRHELVRDYYQIDSTEINRVIDEDLPTLREQVARYLSDTDWDEWEKNEITIVEIATHNSLVQTATRMKQRGYNTNEINKITGLSRDEIETL